MKRGASGKPQPPAQTAPDLQTRRKTQNCPKAETSAAFLKRQFFLKEQEKTIIGRRRYIYIYMIQPSLAPPPTPPHPPHPPHPPMVMFSQAGSTVCIYHRSDACHYKASLQLCRCIGRQGGCLWVPLAGVTHVSRRESARTPPRRSFTTHTGCNLHGVYGNTIPVGIFHVLKTIACLPFLV